jgi:hypothetical protein
LQESGGAGTMEALVPGSESSRAPAFLRVYVGEQKTGVIISNPDDILLQNRNSFIERGKTL